MEVMPAPDNLISPCIMNFSTMQVTFSRLSGLLDKLTKIYLKSKVRINI
jgi:hypothetical protein